MVQYDDRLLGASPITLSNLPAGHWWVGDSYGLSFGRVCPNCSLGTTLLYMGTQQVQIQGCISTDLVSAPIELCIRCGTLSDSSVLQGVPHIDWSGSEVRVGYYYGMRDLTIGIPIQVYAIPQTRRPTHSLFGNPSVQAPDGTRVVLADPHWTAQLVSKPYFRPMAEWTPLHNPEPLGKTTLFHVARHARVIEECASNLFLAPMRVVDEFLVEIDAVDWTQELSSSSPYQQKAIRRWIARQLMHAQRTLRAREAAIRSLEQHFQHLTAVLV